MTEIVEGFFYEIFSNERPELVLDVRGGSLLDAADVILFPKTGRFNQQWQFFQIAPLRYNIVARHSGLHLDVSGASMDDGAHVIQFPRVPNADNQQWNLNADASGIFILTSVHSNKVLDASGGAHQDAQLIQFHPTGNANQSWGVNLKEGN